LFLDASVVLTWCFPDEESQKAVEISELIAGGDRGAVPAFWRHEILNALVGERRKRLTRELSQAFIDDLNRLPVDVDEHATSAIVFDVTQSLCRRHGLTAYDAAYLEIALRGDHGLATLDDDLRRAAVAEYRCSDRPAGGRRETVVITGTTAPKAGIK
jgi:predicted nucleic acid-binding protein